MIRRRSRPELKSEGRRSAADGGGESGSESTGGGGTELGVSSGPAAQRSCSAGRRDLEGRRLASGGENLRGGVRRLEAAQEDSSRTGGVSAVPGRRWRRESSRARAAGFSATAQGRRRGAAGKARASRWRSFSAAAFSLSSLSGTLGPHVRFPWKNVTSRFSSPFFFSNFTNSTLSPLFLI